MIDKDNIPISALSLSGENVSLVIHFTDGEVIIIPSGSQTVTIGDYGSELIIQQRRKKDVAQKANWRAQYSLSQEIINLKVEYSLVQSICVEDGGEIIMYSENPTCKSEMMVSYGLTYDLDDIDIMLVRVLAENASNSRENISI